MTPEIIVVIALALLVLIHDVMLNRTRERLRKLEFMHQCTLNDPEFIQDYRAGTECKGPEFNQEDEVE